MIATGQSFANLVVELDGCSFMRCVFRHCELRLSGLLPVTLQDCEFLDCAWRFSGPATTTIAFMTAMHRAGAGTLIEQTCAQILAGGASGPANTEEPVTVASAIVAQIPEPPKKPPRKKALASRKPKSPSP